VSTNVQSAPADEPAKSPRLNLRPTHFEDYAQIVALEGPLNPQAPTPDEWRALWQGNPLWADVGNTWPIGWVLEGRDGRIVGSLGNIPLLYHFRGERLIGASGRGWVVEPEYRGFALWLLDERFHQPRVDVFMDTTISPLALEAFDEFAHRVPAGDWETIAYCIVDYRTFVARALQKINAPFAPALASPAAAGLRLKDALFGKALPRAVASVEIEAADRFDSRFDAFWHELLRQNSETLLAARDGATLSWHFATASRRQRVWILTASRNGRLRAYAIFKRAGGSEELSRMRLVDFQTLEPETDLLPSLLGAALRRCAHEGVCVLEKAGTGLNKTRDFERFAPYRRKQTWPTFYRAVDPALAVELRRPEVWDPSEFDGDASLE
jgi:hypothetical protein